MIRRRRLARAVTRWRGLVSAVTWRPGPPRALIRWCAVGCLPRHGERTTREIRVRIHVRVEGRQGHEQNKDRSAREGEREMVADETSGPVRGSGAGLYARSPAEFQPDQRGGRKPASVTATSRRTAALDESPLAASRALMQ